MLSRNPTGQLSLVPATAPRNRYQILVDAASAQEVVDKVRVHGNKYQEALLYFHEDIVNRRRAALLSTCPQALPDLARMLAYHPDSSYTIKVPGTVIDDDPKTQIMLILENPPDHDIGVTQH